MTSSPQPVEVVAGVLMDADGRVLLARRTSAQDWAGRWEFPGGKREPGEDAASALVRELHEELGIVVEASAPLARTPWSVGARALTLEVRHVTCWRGQPYPREGQELCWQHARDMRRESMPPADWPAVQSLRLPPLIRITPPYFGEAELPRVRAALLAGDALVRLRLDDPAREHQIARQLASGAGEERTRLLLGGRQMALARDLGCGLQLQARQIDELALRPVTASQWCGASCHGAGDLQRAQQLDLDFAVVGPVRATPTHRTAQGLGWPAFASLCERTALPVYALGGLAPMDLAAAQTAGARGVAGIRAFWN